MARKKKIVYFDPKIIPILKANTYMSPGLIRMIRLVSGGFLDD